MLRTQIFAVYILSHSIFLRLNLESFYSLNLCSDEPPCKKNGSVPPNIFLPFPEFFCVKQLCQNLLYWSIVTYLKSIFKEFRARGLEEFFPQEKWISLNHRYKNSLFQFSFRFYGKLIITFCQLYTLHVNKISCV